MFLISVVLQVENLGGGMKAASRMGSQHLTKTNTLIFITSDFAGLSDYIMSGFQTFWPFKKMCLKAYSFLPTARISISNVSVGVDFPALKVRRHFFANIDRGPYSVV